MIVSGVVTDWALANDAVATPIQAQRLAEVIKVALECMLVALLTPQPGRRLDCWTAGLLDFTEVLNELLEPRKR